VVILSLECCSKPVIDFVVLHFILAIFFSYYCVIVAFCQHVLNEHAKLCYATEPGKEKLGFFKLIYIAP